MVEQNQQKKCKDCTNGEYKEGDIMMYCRIARSKVYYLSVACQNFDDTTIF